MCDFPCCKWCVSSFGAHLPASWVMQFIEKCGNDICKWIKTGRNKKTKMKQANKQHTYIISYHKININQYIHPYIHLFIIIYHYLSWSIYHYLSLSTIIYHYLSVNESINLSVYLQSVRARVCVCLCVCVYVPFAPNNNINDWSFSSHRFIIPQCSLC